MGGDAPFARLRGTALRGDLWPDPALFARGHAQTIRGKRQHRQPQRIGHPHRTEILAMLTAKRDLYFACRAANIGAFADRTGIVL